ncbi:WecB/TagA/CpsF family glycosyltransferase [Actinotalea sp. BY-33]|uniref:WecB/TagA/CpsF family glycosyltransferase n=1 Tax=Actinotalea soli TaxID=2819234 RepID=A0A939LMA4_9CELL|nr:WecB/TagA/CpsF family glycosyltransferase [Actinotalea soli]MBO1750297.1 WecB/TagA/CpsF family glycosyltransferase [Actinotalea soli]
MTAGTRVDILGVHVSVTSQEEVAQVAAALIASGERGYVCVSDVNAVLNASRSPDLLEIHNSSTLTLPDGMPLVWSGRRAGAPMQRVCGPDLLPSLLAVALEQGWRSYFYGGADGVAVEMVERLTRLIGPFPTAGVMSPPYRTLSAQEDEEVVRTINESRADIVWVGLGAPKQERWMAEHRSRLDAALLVGVGAAFDMHAGRVARAPGWMQRAGLEWSYRLLQEPRRLWRRYVFGIPAFLLGVARRRPRIVPG